MKYYKLLKNCRLVSTCGQSTHNPVPILYAGRPASLERTIPNLFINDISACKGCRVPHALRVLCLKICNVFAK